MNEFCRHRSEKFRIIIVDSGAFHKRSELKVTADMSLLFVPPYSPELNLAEMM